MYRALERIQTSTGGEFHYFMNCLYLPLTKGQKLDEGRSGITMVAVTF